MDEMLKFPMRRDWDSTSSSPPSSVLLLVEAVVEKRELRPKESLMPLPPDDGGF